MREKWVGGEKKIKANGHFTVLCRCVETYGGAGRNSHKLEHLRNECVSRVVTGWEAARELTINWSTDKVCFHLCDYDIIV